MIQVKDQKIGYNQKEADDIQTEKNQLSLEEIDESYNLVINKTQQELLDFYQPLMDRCSYEAIMTQFIHLELLLRKLIAKRSQLNLDDFSKSSLFDLINIAFIEGLIDERQGKELHGLRNKRNRFAHEFLTQTSLSPAQIMEIQGKNFIKIIEINRLINDLK